MHCERVNCISTYVYVNYEIKCTTSKILNAMVIARHLAFCKKYVQQP